MAHPVTLIAEIFVLVIKTWQAAFWLQESHQSKWDSGSQQVYTDPQLYNNKNATMTEEERRGRIVERLQKRIKDKHEELRLALKNQPDFQFNSDANYHFGVNLEAENPVFVFTANASESSTVIPSTVTERKNKQKANQQLESSDVDTKKTDQLEERKAKKRRSSDLDELKSDIQEKRDDQVTKLEVPEKINDPSNTETLHSDVSSTITPTGTTNTNIKETQDTIDSSNDTTTSTVSTTVINIATLVSDKKEDEQETKKRKRRENEKQKAQKKLENSTEKCKEIAEEGSQNLKKRSISDEEQQNLSKSSEHKTHKRSKSSEGEKSASNLPTEENETEKPIVKPLASHKSKRIRERVEKKNISKQRRNFIH